MPPPTPLSVRRIVLPTDFSVCAERALPRALALAEQFDAEIHLVHVLPAPGVGQDIDEVYTWREESARTRLEATRMAYRYGLPGAHAAPMELVVVRDGHPAEAITRYARSHEADLIVMGTHGRSFRRDATMGSITAGVLRQAPCPVMTVSAFRPSTGMIRKVLAVASEPAMTPTVLHYASNLAAAFDAGLALLASSPSNSSTPSNGTSKRDREALAEALREAGLPETLPVFRPAAALATTLPHLAAEVGADLIVMPAHLHSDQGPDQAYQIVRSVAGSVLALESQPDDVIERPAPRIPSLPARA